MNHTPLSQDPADEATNSAVFVPLDASLVRKLAAAEQTVEQSTVFSEPSDDESERRYSDVSADPVQLHPTCPSPDTFQLIRQWNLRLHDNDSQQDSPPTPKQRVRKPSTLRSFGQPTSYSSNRFSPTLSRRYEETLPSVTRPCDERKRSLHSSGPALEPKRYEFYGPAQENNPAYHSTPYFSIGTPRAHPIRPIAPQGPQKNKISAFWKFLSGKRRPKRERTTEQLMDAHSFQPANEPVKEKRDWKVDSFRRLRRSGRNPSNADELFTNTHSTPIHRQSASLKPRLQARNRAVLRSRQNSYTVDHQYSSTARMLNNDSPSVGVLPGTTLHGNGERLGSHFDSKKEASSVATYRGRVMFMTEGSSVSSLSDREDDSNVESSHLYLSKRQLRAMQYK